MSKSDFTAKIRSLTPKPRSVLKLILAGKSDDEIAVELDTSMSTIRKHVQNLCDHFGLTREYRGLKRNRREDLIALMREYHLDLENEEAIALPPKNKLIEVSDRVASTIDSETDWGEAIDVSLFYGRESELAQLRQWIVEDGCRLVGLLGMDGIGKTALSVKVAEQLQDQFQLVIWRSLRYAPEPDELLSDLLQIFAKYQEPSETEPLGGKISLLIDYLRQFRCLLVLDEVEAVLQPNRVGHYLENHKKYGELLRRVADERHQSCFLITSREKPKELVSREGQSLQVRSLTLEGLEDKAAQAILMGKGVGSDNQCQQLIHLYRANPLMLKLVAATVQDLFNNNVSEFLAQKTLVFDGIRSLLKKQFNRLSGLEKQVIYWIAINREPVSLTELREDMALPASNRRLLEALQALERRSLIGKTVDPHSEDGHTTNTLFELQPVVLEYVTERFVEELGEEIARGEIDLLNSHAVLKAHSPDYIREQQIQCILKPLIDELLVELSDAGCLVSEKRIEEQLKDICSMLQRKYPLESGYAAGNIINLLNHIKIEQNRVDLSKWDFSQLVIWQAYLQGILLHHTQFQRSHVEKSVFTELLSDVLSIAFSPDGTLLAMGDVEGNVHLWQTSNYQKLNDWQAHSSWIRSIAFSPDSRTLATGGDDCKIILWDVETGQCQKQLLELKDWVRSLAFSPDGRYLTSGGDEWVVRLWLVETGELVRELMGHRGRVRSVAFSPDGHWIASGSDDREIRLWDIEQGICQHTLTGHQHWVRSIAFSPDGALLVSSSNDRTVRLWDVATATSQQVLGEHDAWVRSVAFSPNGEFIASGSDDRRVKIWNVKTGKLLRTLEEHSSRVWSVAFSPDSSKLASSSDDQRVKVWSVQKGHCLKLFQGYASGIRSVAFRREGNSLFLASGGDDNRIHLWDVATREPLKLIEGHMGRILSIAFSPQEDVIASGSDDHTVRLWNLQTGKLLRVLEHSNWVRSLAFSPNGQILASAGDDGMIRLWQIHKPGCPVLELKGHEHWVRSLAFSPDGRMLVSGGDDQTVRQWDIENRKFVKILERHGHRVRSVAFSPDGSILASGGDDKTVNLLNLKTGERQSLNDHTLGVKTVAFSPDGHWLATGSDDRTIKLWNVKTGECVQTLSEESLGVRSLAFSPDGRFLASGGQGDTICLWQAELGQKQNQCIAKLQLERPYEGMDITGVTGLSLCQKETLLALGAIDSDWQPLYGIL